MSSEIGGLYDQSHQTYSPTEPQTGCNLSHYKFEPQRQKTYLLTYAPNEDSTQSYSHYKNTPIQIYRKFHL